MKLGVQSACITCLGPLQHTLSSSTYGWLHAYIVHDCAETLPRVRESGPGRREQTPGHVDGVYIVLEHAKRYDTPVTTRALIPTARFTRRPPQGWKPLLRPARDSCCRKVTKPGRKIHGCRNVPTSLSQYFSWDLTSPQGGGSNTSSLTDLYIVRYIRCCKVTPTSRKVQSHSNVRQAEVRPGCNRGAS